MWKCGNGLPGFAHTRSLGAGQFLAPPDNFSALLHNLGMSPISPSAVKAIPHAAAGWLALLTGALVWGLIWYPYRVLEGLGVSGGAATLGTYVLGLALTLIFVPGARCRIPPRLILLALALAAGGCNLGYVVAMLDGHVMRVLLLFYLSPLWTVVLARLLLAERLSLVHAGVVALSLAGAVTMLWRPEQGWPLPACRAEWLGLAAGVCFSLMNVLARRARDLSEQLRTLAMFVGTILVAVLVWALGLAPVHFVPRDPPQAALLLLALGLTLMAVNMVVQYGLAVMPANRASVILLTELAFAAVGAQFLAGETMALPEMLGGALIAAASLLAIRLGGGH